MQRQLYQLFFIICTLIALNSCVSVKLGENFQSSAKKNFTFTEPNQPFVKVDLDQADEAWQSSKTGNNISIFTDCRPNSSSLKSLRSSLFGGVEDLIVNEEKTLTFNNREALQSVITGKMEGVPVKINILIFKKNECVYNITYVALTERYEKEIPIFKKFLEGFKVND